MLDLHCQLLVVAFLMAEPRERYHHGDLRNSLIEAATRILDDEGIKALSLRAVARRAGVSQAAPYRHFADKEALLAAVAAEGFKLLSKSMNDAAANAAPGPSAEFRALGQGYVAFATSNPNRFRLMFTHEIPDWSIHAGLIAAANEAYSIISVAVHERLSQPGAASVDPRLATVAGWAGVHGLATLIADRQIVPFMTGGADDQTIARVVTGLFDAGLGNRDGFTQ